MLIDSHQHVFWHRRDDAGLIADMDEHDIDLAWLLTWEIAPEEDWRHFHRALNPANLRPDGTHAGITLRDLLITRDRYPDRFVLGYCPHPLYGDAPSLFEAAYYMHGVRVCGEWKFRVLFDDPRCLNLFRKAGELKCPVVLHIDVPYRVDENGERQYQEKWYAGTIDNLERALIACPETNFIGHAPGFWRCISGDAESDPAEYPDGPVTPGGRIEALFEKYPNLYADLSAGSGRRAMSRDLENAKRFIQRFSHRLLFGRDIYGGTLWELLQSLELPQSVMDNLCFKNAQSLLARASEAAESLVVKTH